MNVLELFPFERELINLGPFPTIDTQVIHLNRQTTKWMDGVLSIRYFINSPFKWKLKSLSLSGLSLYCMSN